MSEEDQYTEVDLSNVDEDTERYLESHYRISEVTDSELGSVQEPDVINSVDQSLSEKKVQNVIRSKVIRPTELPLGRIKNIMRMDPDVNVINGDAVFLVTKATEMFLETIAKETYEYTSQHKRKTIAKKDLDTVINKVDCLCFLEGAMDF